MNHSYIFDRRRLVTIGIAMSLVGAGLAMDASNALGEETPASELDSEQAVVVVVSRGSGTSPLGVDGPDEEGASVEGAAPRSLLFSYSPAGCKGKSHNAHHTDPIIKGVGQTKCDILVSELHVTAQLWRLRWWGFQRVGDPGPRTNSWSALVKGSARFNGCENNTWRTTSFHYSIEGGVTYTASSVGNEVDISTC